MTTHKSDRNAYLGAGPAKSNNPNTKIATYPARHKAGQGECTYCDKMRSQRVEFHPSHDASRLCESGKRDHCTCDMCF